MGTPARFAIFLVTILCLSTLPFPIEETSLEPSTQKSSMSSAQSVYMYFFDNNSNRHVVNISTDHTHYLCGVKDNGNYSCGGRVNTDYAYGQYQSVMLLDQRNFSSSVADFYNFCGIETNSNISCIGQNTYGQLGNGNTVSTTSQFQQVLLPSGVVPINIATAEDNYCITTSLNEIYCWGRNREGMVTPGSSVDYFHTPQELDFSISGDIVQLVGGSDGFCILTSTNDVHCWGAYNDVHSVLQSDNSHALHGMTITEISTDREVVCATTNDSQIFCWGLGTTGVLGDGDTTVWNRTKPTNAVALPQGFEVSKTVIHENSICALSTNSEVVCWGQGFLNRQQNFFSPVTLILPEYISGVSDMYFTSSNDLTLVSDDGYYFNYLGPYSAEPFFKSYTPVFYEGVTTEIHAWSSAFNSDNFSSVSITSHTVPEVEFTIESNLPHIGGTPANWSLQCNGVERAAQCNKYRDIHFGISGQNYTSRFYTYFIGDFDADGIFDNTDLDDDNDGFSDAQDDCDFLYGNSTRTPVGCLDQDGDGFADTIDEFPLDKTQQDDSDSDGFGDNLTGSRGDDCPADFGRSIFGGIYGCWDSDNDGWADTIDSFVSDPSQWSDQDGDGFGDNTIGYRGDACPNDAGNSTIDRFGCPDDDGDGHSNGNDDFPNDSELWQDSDGDGVPDESDAFPFNAAQFADTDGDGYGDNQQGGSGSDAFPLEATQWSDIDGDGYGDNQNGTEPDAFIADPTQWVDDDGDGYGDNPAGRQADMFPNDSTQWEDLDGDGLGDNLSGNNPDPYLFDFDNDGYNDSIDPLPKLSSPGDMDNDGTNDSEDVFPNNPAEWADADGDGEGDNADTDDDNDGWPDADEIRAGTDPFASSEQPIDTFEIVVPGTAIGLGAWDLIGIFGGIPLFAWIGFGFATRNSRAGKFESQLREAKSRNELEEIATQWEYALMLRLIGPHQGIRLERLRSELDDWFENQSQPLSSVNDLESLHQTHLVEQEMEVEIEPKVLPSIESGGLAHPPVTQGAQSTDSDGYEWYTAEDRRSFYRETDSGSEWVEYNG